MIEEVAITPLIFVVKIFPDDDCVNELMKLTTLDAIPFTNEVKELEVVEIVLEFTIVVVETEPPIFEVIVLMTDDKVFGTLKLVTVALVMVALAIVPSGSVIEALDKSKFPEIFVFPERFVELVEFKPKVLIVLVCKLFPVAESKTRLKMFAFSVFVVEALVVEAFSVTKFPLVPHRVPIKEEVKLASVEKIFVAERLVAVALVNVALVAITPSKVGFAVNE
jgi:hypothetical protein